MEITNFTLTGSNSNWGSSTLNSENFQSNNSLVYPNPTSSSLNLISKSEINSIQIIDLSGRIIMQKELKATFETNLDVSHFNSGIYFAILNQSQKIKFIKQ
jgi:hypothetical protein